VNVQLILGSRESRIDGERNFAEPWLRLSPRSIQGTGCSGEPSMGSGLSARRRTYPRSQGNMRNTESGSTRSGFRTC
jgi:hypothetical protein